MELKIIEKLKRFIFKLLFINNIKRAINIFFNSVRLRIKFRNDLRFYNRIAEVKAMKEDLFPCILDATSTTEIEPTYFYQDAWAFERILYEKPINHIDVGSNHMFVSLLSKITNLTMIDIRPLALHLDSINFIEGNILRLPFEDETIESFSSLCVIEHVGLGRYGDQIDPNGSIKTFVEINRILKLGANFYFSVPVENTNRVYFNAHRSFSEDYLFNTLLSNYIVLDKKYIYGNEFFDKINPSVFGIGCYHIKKMNNHGNC